MVAAAVALLLVFCVSASGGGLPGILGVDDRVSVSSGSWPWSAIGRVNLPTGGFCSGAVIGSRHVLTAAHCLYDHQRLSWYPPEELEFVAGLGGGMSASADAVELVLAIADGEYRDLAIAQPTRNWAILILDKEIGVRPIPWRVIGPAGLLETLREGKATLVRAGYSEDSADRLSAHFGCDFAGVSSVNGMLLHGCDATLGDAGSPILLMRSGGDATLVAINVAVQHDADLTFGVAVPAAAFDEVARTLLTQNRVPPATH